MKEKDRIKSPRERAVDASMQEQEELRKKREKKRKKIHGKWGIDIGLSQGCCFGTGEKEPIMKMFEISLDHQIREAKKTHRIVLMCVWKNLGCRPVDDTKEWEVFQEAIKKLNKEE